MREGARRLRVLLAPMGTFGDVGPLVAYGVHLRQRGHEVAVCTSAEWAPFVHRHHLEHLPLPASATGLLAADPAVLGSPLRGALRLLRSLAQLTEAMFEPLRAAAPRFDRIVGSGAQLASAAVAEAARRPYAHLVHSPSWFPSGQHTPPAVPFQSRSPLVNAALWRLFGAAFHRVTGPVVNRQRVALGLAPVADVYAAFRAVAVVSQDPRLGPVPADCAGVRQVPYLEAPPEDGGLPPELRAFLSRGPTPVYVGFGSMPLPRDPEVLASVGRALAALGVRAVLQVGPTDRVPPGGPATFVLRCRVSHAELFLHLRACVHHGGAGTVYQATRAGVPQVVVPQILDQFYWARRVHELGLGPPPLSFRRPGDRVVRAALERALFDTRLREAARDAARRLTPPDAAPLSALLDIHP